MVIVKLDSLQPPKKHMHTSLITRTINKYISQAEREQIP